ncbi:MAG: CBS domain-containing protein [Deltaproteobacteria bacterium]|nr:CBS domain-containing protein [Deltaproteobacteria bacterium]MCL4874321.1 CBS domain-containing protein [bacterium]
MQLRQIMQKKVITAGPDASVREVAKKMKDYRIGYLLLTNGEAIKGCVTDRDIVVWLAGGKDPDATKINSIMRTNVITSPPDTDVFDASKLMARKKIRRLPVVEGNKLLGLVSVSDLASVIEEEVDNFFHVEEAYQI